MKIPHVCSQFASSVQRGIQENPFMSVTISVLSGALAMHIFNCFTQSNNHSTSLLDRSVLALENTSNSLVNYLGAKGKEKGDSNGVIEGDHSNTTQSSNNSSILQDRLTIALERLSDLMTRVFMGEDANPDKAAQAAAASKSSEEQIEVEEDANPDKAAQAAAASKSSEEQIEVEEDANPDKAAQVATASTDSEKGNVSGEES